MNLLTLIIAIIIVAILFGFALDAILEWFDAAALDGDEE